jgi:hypothetical protein
MHYISYPLPPPVCVTIHCSWFISLTVLFSSNTHTHIHTFAYEHALQNPVQFGTALNTGHFRLPAHVSSTRHKTIFHRLHNFNYRSYFKKIVFCTQYRVGTSDSLEKSANKGNAYVFASLNKLRLFRTRNTKLTEYVLSGR